MNSNKAKTKENYLNQTLMNGLKILEQFNENNSKLGINELEKTIDLNKSSVWRLIYTLEYLGYLKKVPEEEKYTLGFEGLKFAKIILNRLKIRGIALPYLEDLSAELNLSVNLCVMENDEAILIATASAPDIPDNYFHVGRVFPLYCSSSGKVLLANLPEEDKNSIIENLELRQLTPNTITDKNKLKKHLNQIVKTGYAVDNEEYLPGTKCLAFPIKNNTGQVIASISVSNRKLNLLEEFDVSQYLDNVSKIANKISHELGYGLYDPLGSN